MSTAAIADDVDSSWEGATTKRLHLWGKQIDEGDVVFEWPTQDDFAEMSPDVKLSSIEFKAAYSTLSSVKVNLSNEQSSEVFESASHSDYDNYQKIDFDSNTSIRAVEAKEGESYVNSISFFDD